MWRNKLTVTIAAATLLAAAVPASAALSRQDRKAAQKLLAGDLYLRIQLRPSERSRSASFRASRS